MDAKSEIRTIDQYIAQFPTNVQEILQTIRSIIQRKAIGATETISYQIPTFKLNGNLIHFAAYKNHIGLYPTSSGVAAFNEELSKYKSGRGSIQFQLNQPIPYDLIEKIVDYRIKEGME